MKKNIAIAGAGLVGSLLAIYLLRRGYHVTIFERRPDMRKNQAGAGRSNNLALSNRGLHALDEVGLSNDLRAVAIPMHGRMVHDRQGNTNDDGVQPLQMNYRSIRLHGYPVHDRPPNCY